MEKNVADLCDLSTFNIMIFNGVQTYGLQFLPFGLFSVIVYLQPVLVVLLAWLWFKESLTIIKIVGMVIGFLGVVAVSLQGISGQVSFLWYFTSFHYRFNLQAIGTVYVKKTSVLVNGLWFMAIQNIIGGIVLSRMGCCGQCNRYSMESSIRIDYFILVLC